uniref:hypothetical protein n=1 Tax=uncultured Sphingomonas sp. TaxID=158754 RepID=UPI0035CB643A
MSTHKGKAWSVFPTQERDSTRAVTQVIVRPTDPDTVRYAKDLIAQQQLVVPAFVPDTEIAFYVPAEGPQPVYGDDLEWGAHHVDVTRVEGSKFMLRKIGCDFDPNAPIH